MAHHGAVEQPGGVARGFGRRLGVSIEDRAGDALPGERTRGGGAGALRRRGGRNGLHIAGWLGLSVEQGPHGR